MIDDFAILVSHTLLALAAWRLLARTDLDSDAPVADPRDGDDSPAPAAPAIAAPRPLVPALKFGDGGRA